MLGFFNKKEIESVSAIKGQIHSCASCGLYRQCQSPQMKPRGGFKKNIMCLGEAPGKLEDQNGKPWQGEGGELLKRIFKQNGIDLFEDCINLYAINCKPAQSKPSTESINHCRAVKIWPTIKKYKPDIIFAFGNAALKSLIEHRWDKSCTVAKMRGNCIPDQDLNAWIIPVYDPNYLIYKKKPKDLIQFFTDDIKLGLKKIGQLVPKYKEPDIEYVDDLSFLNDYPEHKLSAFDYETTGLKPHRKEHRILTCSIADNENHVWVFQGPKKKSLWQPFRRWLANKNIPKVAQNMKYEHQWSKEILKVETKGWVWDTMLASHILNNRSGTTGLKFNTYLKFGIIGYEDEVSDYMRTPKDPNGEEKYGENLLNQMQELMKTSSGAKKVMKYNALDSINEYRLAKLQMKELNSL